MNSINGHRCLALVIACLSMALPFAQAAIVPRQALAVAQVSRSSGSLSVQHSLNIQLGYFDGSLFNSAPLFEQFFLTGSDVGKTFTLATVDDPDFALFVQKLTNGSNDGLGITDNLGTITAQQEPEFFTLLAADNNGLDLQGFQIGSITMQVNALTINTPGSDPNGDGEWTDSFFEGTFTVYAVPEPSTCMLLAVAGLTCWPSIYRRNQKGSKRCQKGKKVSPIVERHSTSSRYDTLFTNSRD